MGGFTRKISTGVLTILRAVARLVAVVKLRQIFEGGKKEGGR